MQWTKMQTAVERERYILGSLSLSLSNVKKTLLPLALERKRECPNYIFFFLPSYTFSPKGMFPPCLYALRRRIILKNYETK